MGVKLEILRMLLYLSFPVGVFWVSNQAEYFQRHVVQRKREIFPPDDPERGPVERLRATEQDGRPLHPGEVPAAGAGAGSPPLRGQPQRLRPPLLRAGPVLPEPRLLGGRAAGQAGPPGPPSGPPRPGRLGGPGEERTAGDEGPQRPPLREGPRLAGALRQRGR
ncbi:collagen alpha-1(III) chain isoform X3 [Chroicocephalus ridibundus]|uniref:collagen alpha-1(III) chain isoform X3 n=1 Tax=Chroicocephalus ridibundus TaxID=1192867 RepID=UPI002FDEF3F8